MKAEPGLLTQARESELLLVIYGETSDLLPVARYPGEVAALSHGQQLM